MASGPHFELRVFRTLTPATGPMTMRRPSAITAPYAEACGRARSLVEAVAQSERPGGGQTIRDTSAWTGPAATDTGADDRRENRRRDLERSGETLHYQGLRSDIDP